MYLGICEVKLASIKLIFNFQMEVNNFDIGYKKEAPVFSHFHIVGYHDDEVILVNKITIISADSTVNTLSM